MTGFLPVMGDVNFNPLPPQGGRQINICVHRYSYRISIHSLPKEGDFAFCAYSVFPVIISIHSLPKEGDGDEQFQNINLVNFNPLPPQGGRRSHVPMWQERPRFQSTPSPRRETTTSTPCSRFGHAISIHSLPKEGDPETL